MNVIYDTEYLRGDLYNYLKNNQLTQRHVAKQLNVSVSTISRFLTGKYKNPNIQKLAAIAMFMNKSLDEYIMGSGNICLVPRPESVYIDNLSLEEIEELIAKLSERRKDLLRAEISQLITEIQIKTKRLNELNNTDTGD